MENQTNKSEREPFEAFCLVELMGHQKIAGKVTEAVIAGHPFLRIDVPGFEENKPFTRFFSPGAVYSINPTTEEIVMASVRQYRNEPVSRFEFPQLAEKAGREEGEPALF